MLAIVRHIQHLQTLVSAVSLLVVLQITSCKCNDLENPKTGEASSSEVLNMEVSVKNLGDVASIEVELTAKKEIRLKDYKLRIQFTETGGNGSKLTYTSHTNESKIITTALEESISHFYAKNIISPNESPLKIPFNLTPGPQVTSIALIFEILDQAGKSIQKMPAKWERSVSTKLVDLSLTSSNGTQLKSNEPLNLHIINNGKQPSEAGKLKLIIARDNGTHASIIGATPKTEGVYELPLAESIPNNDSGMTKSLTTQLGADKKAQFTIRAYYEDGQGQPIISEPLTVTWELPDPLVLSNIEYINITGNLIYTLANNGTGAVGDIKLHYISKNPGVEIDNKPVNSAQEVKVGALGPSKQQADKILGRLDFGGNQQVEFDFWLTHAGHTDEFDKQTKTFVLPSTKLKLVSKGPTILTGDRPSMTLKIEKEGNNYVDLSKLKISISNSSKAAKVLHNSKVVTELSGTELGEIGSEITLTLEPATEEQVKVLMTLMNNKIPQDIIDFTWGKSTMKALRRTISNNDVGRLKQLLNQDSSKISDKDEDGSTLLHYAATLSNKEIISVLLSYKADINATDKLGYTPLHSAIETGTQEAREELLKTPDIQVNKPDKNGYTPLHSAIRIGYPEPVKALLAHKGIDIDAITNNILKQAPIHMAAESYDLLDELIERVANLNIQDAGGDTPLHIAIKKSYTENAKKLINRGVNLDIQNAQGNTPLHEAIRQGNKEIIELLLNKGANRSLLNKQGKTPGVLGDEMNIEEIKKLLNKPLPTK